MDWDSGEAEPSERIKLQLDWPNLSELERRMDATRGARGAGKRRQPSSPPQHTMTRFGRWCFRCQSNLS